MNTRTKMPWNSGIIGRLPGWRFDSRMMILIFAAGILWQARSHAADPGSTSKQNSTDRVAPQTASKSAPTSDYKSLANSSKVIRYAQARLGKYDMNRDGVLQPDEWKAIKGNPEQMDANKDGIITQEELALWIAAYPHRKNDSDESGSTVSENSADASVNPSIRSDTLPRPGIDAAPNETDSPLTSPPRRQRDLKFHVSPKRLPDGIPDWFVARDKDGDAQLTESEFCTSGTSQELAEFKSFDANGDGIVTARECTGKSRDKKSVSTQKSLDDGLPSSNPDAAPRTRRKTKATK